MISLLQTCERRQLDQFRRAVAYQNLFRQNIQSLCKCTPQGNRLAVWIAFQWRGSNRFPNQRRGAEWIAVDAEIQHFVWVEPKSFQFSKIQRAMHGRVNANGHTDSLL